MRIKPTLRKGGGTMCTYHIKVHIGLEEIVTALIAQHLTFGEELIKTRQETMKAAIAFAASYGDYGWTQVDADNMEEFGPRVRAHLADILPEFTPHDDRR